MRRRSDAWERNLNVAHLGERMGKVGDVGEKHGELIERETGRETGRETERETGRLRERLRERPKERLRERLRERRCSTWRLVCRCVERKEGRLDGRFHHEERMVEVDELYGARGLTADADEHRTHTARLRGGSTAAPASADANV